MRKMLLIFGGSTLVYAVLALLMGVLPGIFLSATPPGPGVVPLTAEQLRGREVYVANGCSYCHTQQVRPLDQDKVFGRPSAPGDFAYQTPELLGSERTGPDLTNVGMRQPSEVWQYIHLYDPRAVVPESIMPSFAWLFKTVGALPPGETAVPLPKADAPSQGVVIPTPEAKALVAYLLSLKQPPLPGAMADGTSMPASASAATPGRAGAASDTAASAPVATAATASDGYRFDAAKGQALYTAHCAACHQASGAGLPGAFPPLKGNAVVNGDDVAKHADVVLRGLQGAQVGGVTYASPMPPFAASLSDTQIADILNHERHAWGNQGKPVTPEQVATQRAKGK